MPNKKVNISLLQKTMFMVFLLYSCVVHSIYANIIKDAGKVILESTDVASNASISQTRLNTSQTLKKLKNTINHPPTFLVGTKLTVGYPKKELLHQLSPPYVTKVLAIDEDVGNDGIIRYTADSQHFIIHPQSATIYPRTNAFDNESNLKFTVAATDRNGAPNGLSTNLEIQVIMLSKQDLLVITIKNVMLEDIDDTLKKLTDQTTMKINYLTAAVIPVQITKSSIRDYIKPLEAKATDNSNADFFIKIIIYGLDKIDKPINNEKMKKALESSEMSKDFTVSHWNPQQQDIYQSQIGFIAAIAVLAGLLIVFLVLVGVVYYLKFHRKTKPYDTDEQIVNSTSFVKKLNRYSLTKSNNIPQRRPTGFVFNPPPIDIDEEDEFGEKPKVQKRTSLKNNSLVLDKRILDMKNFNNNIQGLQTKDISPESRSTRRKSVSFSETVENIDIVFDNNKDDATEDRS